MSQPYMDDEDEEAPEAAILIKENIPPSTGFKIVMRRKQGYLKIANLKSKIENGVDTVSYQHQNEMYKLNKYDRLRMKLLLDDQDFYLAFKETMSDIRKHCQKFKGRGHFPKLLTIAITFGQWIIMALGAYFLFMIIQMTIFNPLVQIVALYAEYKLYLLMDKKIKNYRVSYTTKQFDKLIEK